MKVLLVGGGGREHALAWALSASPLVSKLYVAPGNAGIAECAECVPIPAMDLDGLVQFARDTRIDFAVTGPEAPLATGLAERFEDEGIKALGPSAAGAKLESSKGFVKEICAERDIPTARGRQFDRVEPAIAYATGQPHPIVIKADGLAQGKGVVISPTPATTGQAIHAMFAGEFGEAGHRIIVEEFLEGEEASFFVLTDGEHILPLAGAQDHKRAFDHDEGPNTGGMGAYSPAPVLAPKIIDETISRIVRPAVEAMRARGTPYQGVLYAGLMIAQQGPKLIEFNCRFGDPECQVLMLRLKSDLLPALLAARDGVLGSVDLRWRDEAAITVVMAAKGYPGGYQKGTEIRGLEEAAKVPGVRIFHAGTERQDGRLLANGGRVLNVCATGKDLREARDCAYRAIARIQWPEGFCRSDIGWRALHHHRA
ncbi:MAG: phosphoribosylamine--glycine ligase [Alphaproteobacteria bacterium]